MPNKDRTQYVFVHSDNADREVAGQNHTVTFDVPEDSMRCTENEYLEITLIQFTVINNIPNVPTSNRIYIGEQEFSITPGTYRIEQYLRQFNELNSTAVQASFLPVSRKILLTNVSDPEIDEPLIVKFSEDIAPLFGFPGMQDIVLEPAGGFAESSFEIRPQLTNELVVCAHRIMPAGPSRNVANVTAGVSKELETTDIIGVIPLRSAPGALNVYQNKIGAFVMHIYDTDVQNFGLRVTDIKKRPIPDLPSWSATLRVDVISRPKKDPVCTRLDAVLKYMSIFMLMQAVSSSSQREGQDESALPKMRSGAEPIPEPGDYIPGRHNFFF